MIEIARSTGASAKFTGSGGALIGTFQEEEGFQRLKAELEKLDCSVIIPSIVYEENQE